VFDWGHSGLALSTSLVAALNFVQLFWFMRAKTNGLEGRRLANSLARIAAATIGMGAVCWATSQGLISALGIGFWGRLGTVGLSVSVGVGVLYGLCVALRVPELEAAKRAVLSRVVRTGRRA
jgi:putative peptidoglycan lipid II flippase